MFYRDCRKIARKYANATEYGLHATVAYEQALLRHRQHTPAEPRVCAVWGAPIWQRVLRPRPI